MWKTAIFAIAFNENQAERIVNRLKAAGFSGDDISVLFPDKAGSRDFARAQHIKAPEGAATDAGTGGVLDGGLGWLVGIGSLAIPGVGLFIATGPVLAALGGAVVGAAVGGLAGALIDIGIPEHAAKQYEGKIREGNILISAHNEDGTALRRAREIFKHEGAHDISDAGEAPVKRSA